MFQRHSEKAGQGFAPHHRDTGHAVHDQEGGARGQQAGRGPRQGQADQRHCH